MSHKNAAILGATGMIGNYLLEELLKGNEYETIRLIVRRPIQKPHRRVEIKLVDFNDTESVKLALEDTDVLFSAMGTTQKNVKGDKAAYRQADFEIPLKVARLAAENGCRKMVVVTSVGANSNSSTFYLKLKGELEDALSAMGFDSLHIMQPSMLLGDRKENRPMERMLQWGFKFLSPLFIGGLKKYRGVEGRDLARAMIRVSLKEEKGVFRYLVPEISRKDAK